MIHLVSGATEGYPWAKPYWESVVKHTPEAGIAQQLQTYFYWMADIKSRQPQAVPPHPSDQYRVPYPNNRCRCLQDGSFIDWILPLANWDAVIFTDADMIMQRPLNGEELAWLENVRHEPNTVHVGYNQERGATLLEEAELLSFHQGHNLDWGLFDKLLPGWQELPVWNTGVMVATVATWRRLRDMTAALLPVCEAMFNHPAALQFCISYVIGKWLRHALLPRTFHAHGHFGLPDECGWDADGDVIVKGRIEAIHGDSRVPTKSLFRHCLNLDPPKGPEPLKTATGKLP